MRFNVEITDLAESQWKMAQSVLQAQYDIKPNASRACITVLQGDEVRHVEAPVTVLMGLAASLTLAPLAETARRLAETTDTPACEHGSPMVKETESAFPQWGASIRTYGDGCQSYGPYAPETPGEAEKDPDPCPFDRPEKGQIPECTCPQDGGGHAYHCQKASW